MTADDPLLTGPQVAGRLFIKPATWRGYVKRGHAPPPDDPDENTVKERRTPRWRQSTIDAWHASRPGRGTRTDLSKES